jgi:predicted kinase
MANGADELSESSFAPFAIDPLVDCLRLTYADRQPCLILLIGLPGSGKSYLATQLADQIQQACRDRPIVFPIISTDAIRAELFGNAAEQGSWSLIQPEVQRQLRQAVTAIRAGRSPTAIYDATNVRRCYRRAAIAAVRASGFQHIIGIWLDTPLPLCLQRNCQRDRQVPESVIRRMHRQLRGAPPHLNDGFDQLIKFGSEIPLSWRSPPHPIPS